MAESPHWGLSEERSLSLIIGVNLPCPEDEAGKKLFFPLSFSLPFYFLLSFFLLFLLSNPFPFFYKFHRGRTDCLL